MVEMAIFNVQRAITPKVRYPELRFLRSARRLMVLNICVPKNAIQYYGSCTLRRLILFIICVKFHENISNVSMFKGQFLQKYAIQSCDFYALHFVLWCLTFV